MTAEFNAKIETELRGHVEVHEGWGEEIAPYRYRTVYYVYDWSHHADSAAIIGSFDTRPKAIAFAQDWARQHDRDLASAQIIPFQRIGGGNE